VGADAVAAAVGIGADGHDLFQFAELGELRNKLRAVRGIQGILVLQLCHE
jgi:hypothetical protein